MVRASQTRRYPARRVKSDKTRAAILTAAASIFAESGLAGARTDAIAAAAGVNKALLYYYFKSKDALYLAVVGERFGEFHRRALEVLKSRQTVRATLLAFVSMHFDFICQNPQYPRLFQRCMIAGGPGLERLVREYFLPLKAKLTRLIMRGVRSGELRDVDPSNAVISLVGVTVFYFSSPIVRMAGQPDPYEKKRLALRKREILNFVRYGLFKNPEAFQE